MNWFSSFALRLGVGVLIAVPLYVIGFVASACGANPSCYNPFSFAFAIVLFAVGPLVNMPETGWTPLPFIHMASLAVAIAIVLEVRAQTRRVRQDSK